MTQVPPAHKHAHTHKYTYTHTHRQPPHTHTSAQTEQKTCSKLRRGCSKLTYVLPLCTCASVCKCVNVCVRTSQAIPIHSHHSQAFQFPFFLVVVEEFFFLCSFVFGLKGSSRGRVAGTGKRWGKGGYGEAEEQSKHKLSARWANCCHKDTLPRTFHGSRTRARLLISLPTRFLLPHPPPSLYPLVTALCSHCFHSCLPYDKQFNLVWQQQQQP